MHNEFSKVMSERSDKQLIIIVTTDRGKYNAEAITAAEFEIEQRDIDISAHKEIISKAFVERKSVSIVENDIVSSFTRLLHFVIDSLVALVLAFFMAGCTVFFLRDILGIQDQIFRGFLTTFVFLFSYFGYYMVMEAKFQKTVGKFTTNTKVVLANGAKPSTATIFVRTLCRLIPIDLFSYIFVKNGIHDFLSKTHVVKDKNSNSIGD